MTNKTTMPEPVAVVTSVFGLCWAGTGAIAPMIERTNTKVGDPLITTTQAKTYADVRVREALEEAAAQVEQFHPKATPKGIAAAIRALMPKEDI